MYKDLQVNEKLQKAQVMGEKRILIGKITTAHGIKGYVKVRSFAEDETLLETGTVYTSEEGPKTISLKLKNQMKDFWLAEVNGVSDRNVAETLRGTELYIDRETLPEADDDEYYVEDMKGLKVVDGQGNEIGTILDIVNYGASDLIDIRPSNGGQTFYVPFTDEIVLDVDFEKETVTVELPEGL